MMDKDKDNMATLAEPLDFGEPDRQNSIIKVIGVGGGGGNAVNNMYKQGIHDVSFVVCNTDAQALKDSPVPERLQLGSEGLGAGNRPEKGFIRAEVIKYDDYIKYGSEAAVREAGKLGIEGKEYVVQDGDIMHFRFNV